MCDIMTLVGPYSFLYQGKSEMIQTPKVYSTCIYYLQGLVKNKVRCGYQIFPWDVCMCECLGCKKQNENAKVNIKCRK